MLAKPDLGQHRAGDHESCADHFGYGKVFRGSTVPRAPATTGSIVATMAALPAPRRPSPKVYSANPSVVCTTASISSRA